MTYSFVCDCQERGQAGFLAWTWWQLTSCCIQDTPVSLSQPILKSSNMALFSKDDRGIRGFLDPSLVDRTKQAKDAVSQSDGLALSRLELLAYEV